MVYTPTRNLLTPRVIPDNLLTYCLDGTRQRDALDWALGSSSAATYKLIKKFSASVANRTTPVFPSIAFAEDSDAQDVSGDVIPGAYSVTFEISIQNANPDTAVTQSRVYQKAFASMMLNCPAATIGENTGGTVGATTVQLIEIGFDQIKTNEKQNDFLQQFQIRLTISLTGSAYA